MSDTPRRDGSTPVISGNLRQHLDAAFAAVGDIRNRYKWASVPRQLADNALHEIKEAMLLAYPDTRPASSPAEREK